MKKQILTISLTLLLAALTLHSQETSETAETTKSQPTLPRISLAAGWHSRKVARGRVNNPDAIARLDATITYYGLMASVAEYTDLTGFNNADQGSNASARGRINDRRYRAEQFDYLLGYNYTFETDFSPITLSAIWEYDMYPGLRQDYYYDGQKAYGKRHFHETMIHFIFSLDNVLDKESKARLRLATDASYHLENYFWYGRVYGDISYAVTEKLTAGFLTTLHWRNSEARAHNPAYGGHGFGFVNLEGQPYLTWKFNAHLSATAYFAVSTTIEGTTRRTWKKSNAINHTANYWGGMSLNLSF